MADQDIKGLIAAQNEQIEALKALVQEQGAKLAAINEEVAPPAEEVKLETPKETFMVNKEKYRFTVPKYIKPLDGLVLAKDVLANKNMAEMERLVTIKSGVVAKV